MRRREVVTSFLQHNDRILVLKRSQRVGTHQGKWAGVSGSVEGQSPLAQALQEIDEETGQGQTDVRLLREGQPLDITDPENEVVWRVYPFLFEVHDPSSIRLDWEHTECRWIDPADLTGLSTVPCLIDTWDQLWKV